MKRSITALAALSGILLALPVGPVAAKPKAAAAAPTVYQPTIEDWIGVNAAVNNYTLGLELKDEARFNAAFWPDATITAVPEPGKRFTMPYGMALKPPPMPPAGGTMPPMPAGMTPPTGMVPPAGMIPPPGAPPMPAGGPPRTNAIGNTIEPWHLALSHSFEFQSATRATHYGYFVSVYPDLETKKTIVGLPVHYEDLLEKRNGQWRILSRTSVIGVK